MNSGAPQRHWAIAMLLVPSLCLLLFLVLVGLSARDQMQARHEAGKISLAEISLITDRGQLYLDARAEIDLPVTIESGLDSGVPLIFVLTLRFFKPVNYWFDRQLETVEHRFSLRYYELTRHYRVRALETDKSRNYRSLSAALRGLGSVERLPIAINSSNISLLDNTLSFSPSSEGVVAGLALKLDSRSLPLPLQPVVTSSWRLASKEVQWSVN